MKALSVAFKDIQIFLKDRGAVLQLFLLPLIFVVVFSGALTSIGGDSGEETEDTRIALAVVDLDGGEAAAALRADIDAAGGVQVVSYEQSEALRLLEENEISRVLTIPQDFTSGFTEGRPVTLRLLYHPDANAEETEAVRLVIDGVAQDMSLESQILASLRQMGDMQANAPEEFQVFTTERVVAQARAQFERAESEPLVALEQTVPQKEGEREAPPNLDNTPVTGFAVLFIFVTAQMTARSIYDEKKIGSFRRLLSAPISKAALLGGKVVPTFIIGLVQIIVIFAFGAYGLRLFGLSPLPLEKAPLGLALVAVTLALCASAFGVFIAALARTENQIGGMSTLFLWGMGLIGGSIAPLFFLERFLGPLPKIVPHYWANRAFDNLLLRNLGLSGVTNEVLVLLGFTAIFFGVGLWRLDFD